MKMNNPSAELSASADGNSTAAASSSKKPFFRQPGLLKGISLGVMLMVLAHTFISPPTAFATTALLGLEVSCREEVLGAGTSPGTLTIGREEKKRERKRGEEKREGKEKRRKRRGSFSFRLTVPIGRAHDTVIRQFY